MKTTPDLETILKHAPRPEPPEDLLTTLERQIKLTPAFRSVPRASLWRNRRKIWMPLAGLSGTAVIALVLAAVGWFSTTRTLARSLKELGQMKSCHVVERFRSGPTRPITVDKNKPANVYPNFSDAWHPDNPLVLSDHWFQVDPQDPSRPLFRTVSPGNDVWQQGDRVLTIDHETGERSLRLVNAPNSILATLERLAGGMAFLPLQEIKPGQAPDTSQDRATGLWVGEIRQANLSIPSSEMILRVWLNSSNQLPVRIQLLSSGFPQVASEVIMCEYQFSEYDATFPATTFNFDITKQDLAPLGLSRAELEAVGKSAVSFEVTGDSGAEVAGTLQDDSGTQEIRGTVPFTFVHDQRGDLNFDFHMVDGRRRNFGLRFNEMDMRTVTSHLKGKSSVNTLAESVQAAD